MLITLKKSMMITKDIEIEELVRNYPFSVRFLMERNIKCIACGEAIWGTLEEAAREKGYEDEAIAVIVEELNEKNLKPE
jgi:hybrid cluster-associated redox disulfide protein